MNTESGDTKANWLTDDPHPSPTDSKGTYPLSVFIENLSPVSPLRFYQGLAYFEFVVFRLPLVELVESPEGRAAALREEARTEAEAQAREDLEREAGEREVAPRNPPEGPRPTMLSLRTLQASVAAEEAAEIAAGGPKTTAAETREFLATSAPPKVFWRDLDEEAYMQQSQEFSDLSDADMDDEDVERALAADSPKSPKEVDDEVFKSPTETPGGKPKEAAAETAADKVGDRGATIEPLRFKRTASEGGGGGGGGGGEAEKLGTDRAPTRTRIKASRLEVSGGKSTPTPERTLPPTTPTSTTAGNAPGRDAAVTRRDRKTAAEGTTEVKKDKDCGSKTKD